MMLKNFSVQLVKLLKMEIVRKASKAGQPSKESLHAKKKSAAVKHTFGNQEDNLKNINKLWTVVLYGSKTWRKTRNIKNRTF